MYTLCVQSEFSAAHHLMDYPGACKRIHGHNWKVKVAISKPELDDLGMVMDLMALKKELDKCLDPFDHQMINEIPPFDKLNPTSENLAKYIFQDLRKVLPAAVKVDSVEVFETDMLSVTYSGE